MRRMLILGGTGWLGRAIARRALEEGAEVTCAARGLSGAVPEGARLAVIDRTVPDAHQKLEGDWDEVVELSYAPEVVLPALEDLAHRAAHWSLISSVSVYRSNDEPGADESAELVDPVDLSQYPDAKVAAEQASRSRLGDRLLVIRPGLIVGPGDPSDRFGYWPARMARGGRMLAPTLANRFVQVIDVEDLARFTVSAAARGHFGEVNAVGEVLPFEEFLSLTAAAAQFDGTMVAADDETLLAHGVNYWSGPRSLPLWLPPAAAALMQRSGARYSALGGTHTPLPEIIAMVLADERARGLRRARRSGLSAEDEQELLSTLS